MKFYRGKLALVVIATAACLTLPTHADASQSAAIAQSYRATGSTDNFVAGALVSTRKDQSNQVELATTSNAERLVGVIAATPLVTIADDAADVDVVLNGTSEALVSDINGPVAVGDKITVSPIAGIGMKASSDGQIIGNAQSALSVGADSQQRTITDSAGKKQIVHIGRVTLQTGVAFYQAPGSNFLPPVIQRFANSIAGKQVSFIRVLLSGAILVTCIGGIIALIYASVRTSIWSIGRNPLSATSIHKSLYYVGVLGVAILAFGLLASYLLLKL